MAKKEIVFEPYRQPPILPGMYLLEKMVEVDQTVAVGKQGSIEGRFKSSQYFYVGSQRFAIPTGQVFAVFPPSKSMGEHDNVLPHIELNRSTLPWERQPYKQSNEPTPWLGLVLLDEAELNDPQKIKIENLSWKEYREKLSLKEEPGENSKENENASLPIIWGNPAFLLKILPRSGDLRNLSHVRIGATDNNEKFERAILVCNRMPKAGSNSTVHLVSFESRFPDKAQSPETTILENLGRREDGFIPLLSLYSWTFSCPADFGKQTETLKGLLNGLDRGPFSLPQTKAAPAEMKNFLTIGSVPLPHKQRGGNKSISWYRGPFISESQFTPKINFSKTAVNSDQLLLLNEDSGMLDVSYSAAWELGKLLMLSEPSMGHKLQAWKMAQIQKEKYDQQKALNKFLPTRKTVFASDPTSELSKTLETYFSKLGLLKGIPFHYLVPDEALLPKESIRFFKMDTAWVNSLLDGAFSIGGQLSENSIRPWRVAFKEIHGFLIRSDAISGWPSLVVEGFDSANNVTDQGKTEILRKEKLDPGILFCLFKNKPDLLQIYLPAESLHFGFIRPKQKGGLFYKELKNPDTAKELISNGKKVSIDISWRHLEESNLGTIDTLNIMEKISQNGGGGGPAQMAIQLLEGETKMQFKIT